MMRLKDNSRLVGSKILKKDQLNIITNAEYTPCLKENYLIKGCPAWKLKAKKMFHDLETRTVHYEHARIHIFNLPIFYLPYFSHPDPSVNKRTGFLMPTIKSDAQLGDTFALPFFINIAGNKDLTFTPNLQSKGNNFYEINYRHKNEIGTLNLETSINDNNDNQGTRNHFFANADIDNKYGNLELLLQTTNNDTYMRKNNINDLKVLKSGLDFNRFENNKSFSLKTFAYKNLTVHSGEQWEYIYPEINYSIFGIKDKKFNGNLTFHNDFYRHKNLDNSLDTIASSQINWARSDIHKNTGLIFENFLSNRVVALSKDFEGTTADEENLLVFPQISSKISFPLIQANKNYSQTLTPIIMPILAPYNNYTSSQSINNNNIFSINRASSLNQWESGPRVNYGIEWFLNFDDDKDLSLILGQSAKVNKNDHDNSDEISNYMLASRANLGSNKFIDSSMIIDRKNSDIRESNINAYFDFSGFKLAIDHDYISEKYSDPSEQLRIGGNLILNDDFSFNFTGTKDLNKNNNIGYQYGLLYENDCLGIDLNYYKDLTKDRDIAESDGLSLTIVLKPFGSTKGYGTKKLFGPEV